MLKIYYLVLFLLLPSVCYAWGPLTHTYLANEVLFFSFLLPPFVSSIINRFKEDFLYGNIMADMVLGKKYLPQDKSSHSWDFGFRLADGAKTPQQKAFAFGYISHLAADTVAHDILTKESKNIEHTLYELKADSFINKKYWLQAVAIKKSVQKRNDLFLENSICKLFLSFKINKRIYKSLLFMSLFTTGGVMNIVEGHMPFSYTPPRHMIEDLTEESLGRIIDILRHGRTSKIADIKPSGEIIHGKLYKSLFL
ncbi:MAG: zinc dependent phospholipase C family protein [Nitrospirae bacterium]|nr:zinc dependent phospholipase C family protein [Nitrospirota bacterium]MBF0534749.1 zinc dependent phospholipase C family protein [Nitrospirota bacterium]MBF0616423.1 zinc dependent phospholipase C family protein [Nitrospirota bacterium]